MSRVSWGLGVRCAEDVHLVVFVAGLELKKFFFSHQSFVITAYRQTKRQKDEERSSKTTQSAVISRQGRTKAMDIWVLPGGWGVAVDHEIDEVGSQRSWTRKKAWSRFCSSLKGIRQKLLSGFFPLRGYPEAQKPKTFRVAAFYAQKLSGRSAQNRFSRQA